MDRNTVIVAISRSLCACSNLFTEMAINYPREITDKFLDLHWNLLRGKLALACELKCIDTESAALINARISHLVDAAAKVRKVATAKKNLMGHNELARREALDCVYQCAAQVEIAAAELRRPKPSQGREIAAA
jgi:hypothetical protein